MITAFSTALASALIAALWDVGRRFAQRPLESREKELDEALARLHDAETRLVEHAKLLVTHSDKLTNKSLQHVNIPEPAPGGRGPRLRR